MYYDGKTFTSFTALRQVADILDLEIQAAPRFGQLQLSHHAL